MKDAAPGSSAAPAADRRPGVLERLSRARTRVHRTPGGRATWKVVVGAIGVIVLLAGVLMLAFPGPGWATIVLGLLILSTEFEWAARARRRLVLVLRKAGAWFEDLPRWMRIVAGCVSLAVIGALAYLVFALSGVPEWVPAATRDALREWPLVRG